MHDSHSLNLRIVPTAHVNASDVCEIKFSVVELMRVRSNALVNVLTEIPVPFVETAVDGEGQWGGDQEG